MPSLATIRLYGTAPQVGTYVLLGVGDGDAADDTGPVGDAGPGVGAAAMDDPDADDSAAEEAGAAAFEREAPSFDDPLEHPALTTRATPTLSAGTSHDRWRGACIE